MRKSIVQMLDEYKNTVVLLMDLGAYALREDMERYPNRIKNIGIFEPGTIGIASGLALTGLVPVVYGISPFIVQRSLEQLKLDFVYQNLGGNFITTGASYDFSKLGYSHYCMEDVATLKTLPGFEILTPGSPEEFSVLFSSCCMNGKPSYFRMTDYCHQQKVDVEFGKATVIRKGKKAVVIVFAEMLDDVVNACRDMDVTILYYTTAEPFDKDTLIDNLVSEKVFLCEPFYEGTFDHDIYAGLKEYRVNVIDLALPRSVMRSYGTKTEKDKRLELDADGIRKKILAHL